MIRGTDYRQTMSDRRPPLALARLLFVAAVVTTAVLIATAAGQASQGAPPATARDLAQTYFSGALVRAEVLSYSGRVEHDFRIDEGRVVAVRTNAIDLLERDGTRQTIQIGPQTSIAGVGRLFTPNVVVRGARVVAVRDGGGPATQIRPSAAARILGRTFFGPTLVRAEVLNYQGKVLHDYRIDEGRIVNVKQAAVTLLERDGTKQTIPVGPTAVVTMAGQLVDQSFVIKGLTAITIREGGGPAEQIMLASPAPVTGRR